MSLTLSRELVKSSFTLVDNAFLCDFMPEAPTKFTQVYLLGLHLASFENDGQDGLKKLCHTLSMSEEEVQLAFEYWEETGIVEILSTQPLNIKFLELSSSANIVKKIKPGKYKAFNQAIQGVLCGKMIAPNEFNEYYLFLENHGFEPNALVQIAKYCVELKQDNKLSHHYILKVARDFADSDIKTEDLVLKRLQRTFDFSDDLSVVFKGLGLKRNIDYDDRKLFEKWTTKLGFDLDTIYFVAKQNKKYTMQKLDGKLEKYFKARLMSEKEIKLFEKNKSQLLNLAISINNIIGVYYESTAGEIENYISPWMSKGFDQEALVLIAKWCFKHSLRTIDEMDKQVERFFQEGLTTQSAIGQHMEKLAAQEQNVREVLSAAGILRRVGSHDIATYNTWRENWGFGQEMLVFVAGLSSFAANPLQYMNKILSDYKAKGVVTVEQAKALPKVASSTTPQAKQNFQQQNYTEEQLDQLLDKLTNVEF